MSVVDSRGEGPVAEGIAGRQEEPGESHWVLKHMNVCPKGQCIAGSVSRCATIDRHLQEATGGTFLKTGFPLVPL